MSADKHTPGPWSAEDDRSISAPTPDGSGCILPRITIAEVWSGGCGVEQADANALLLAAAPDLLAFAQWLMESYHSEDGMPSAKEIARDARALIEKATGSTP
jgi:hypothetical protein